MPSDRESLTGMGFDAARVDWALKATGNRGLQPAMDHILEHGEQPVPDMGSVSESASSAPMDVDEIDDAEATANLAGLEAKSIKCSECGKTFRNTALANFHAEKSGHTAFEESTEEIKLLTEEEKKAKLAELREKMAEKRSRKAIEEAAEHKENEKIRRKAGKDMNKIKEDLKAKEAIKEAEQRKRDKIEEAKAKAAVKAQIEADKKVRAEKAAREKALREGKPITDNLSTTAPPPASSLSSGVKGREFKETRLQIRMSSGGQPYTATLLSDAPLREVAEFLAGQTLSVDVETVMFAQHFPRKAFSRSDFSKSLRELGLTPSAVLIATIP
ncbi:ubiquitin-related domain-containing protein [Desarmillaria ectypa]|nr:ubiquitin-related domain-containing protein [Desarmillaria ectypa]